MLYFAISRVFDNLGWDRVYSNHPKLAVPVFKNLFCKFYNKILFRPHILLSLLKGDIKTILKTEKTLKTDSGMLQACCEHNEYA